MAKVKQIIFIVFLILTININAQNKKNFNWNNVIEAIAEVESKRDSTAVCDKQHHVGYLQISPIMIKDCNRILGYKRYSLNDRFSKKKSIEIFILIQSYYNKTNNIERAIRLWNGGTGYTVTSTNGYYKKVMKEYNRILSGVKDKKT